MSTTNSGGPQARILVIEDEPQMRLALRRYLEEKNYRVREAGDGPSGLSAYDAFKPDVVLLDLMLPGIDGVEVCRRLRRDHETPIIVLSALGDERTKVAALDEGADDYLTKPFGMEELLARVRVALRHAGSGETSKPLVIDSLRIDFETRSVTLDGSEIHLTPTEYSLLKYLVTHAGKVLTHQAILRAVWGAEYSDTAVLRTYINQLRTKLHDNGPNPRLIRNEPRVGYRFAADAP